MGVRVLVCGGRYYGNRQQLYAALGLAHVELHVDVLIHGACPTGADDLADKWARGRGVPVLPFPAAWHDLVTPPVARRFWRDGTIYNAAAGGVRNQRMIDEGRPDLVIAFAGGKGTADMLRRAKGLPVRRFP